MPLYEYTCQDCLQESEILIKGSEEPECPHCGSRQLQKAFSTFATTGDSHGSAASAKAHAPGCACCMGSQGACGLN